MTLVNMVIMMLFVGAGFAGAQVYVSLSTADYASVQTNGEGNSGWEGYSINGRYNFMSSSNDTVGIYDDVNNRWRMYWDADDFDIRHQNGDLLLQADEDSNTDLYYDGAWKISTHSDGARINGKVKADQYCDENGDNCFTAAAAPTVTTVSNTECMAVNTPGGEIEYVYATCPSGYRRTGCSANFNQVCYGTSACDYLGAYPSGSQTCIGISQHRYEGACTTTFAFCVEE